MDNEINKKNVITENINLINSAKSNLQSDCLLEE
jgi:hypothetical protein